MAQVTADDLQRRTSRASELALSRAQQALDEMSSGIQIDEITLTDSTFPGAVRDAFKAVNDAEAEKALKIEQANEFRTQTLVDTAGEAREELLRLVERFELASASNDQQALTELGRRLDEAFERGHVETEDGREIPISGKASQTINSAKTSRTQLVSRVKSQVDQFESLHEQFVRSPHIVRGKLWQGLLDTVMVRKVNVYWMPAGAQVYLQLSKDPSITKRDDQERLQQQQQTGGGQ
jgi:hypothetical protein